MGRSGAQCGRGTPCRDRLERVAAGDCASHIEEGVPYLSVSFRQCNGAKDVVTFLAFFCGKINATFVFLCSVELPPCLSVSSRTRRVVNPNSLIQGCLRLTRMRMRGSTIYATYSSLLCDLRDLSEAGVKMFFALEEFCRAPPSWSS
jgi:hypothetical protein